MSGEGSKQPEKANKFAFEAIEKSRGEKKRAVVTADNIHKCVAEIMGFKYATSGPSQPAAAQHVVVVDGPSAAAAAAAKNDAELIIKGAKIKRHIREFLHFLLKDAYKWYHPGPCANYNKLLVQVLKQMVKLCRNYAGGNDALGLAGIFTEKIFFNKTGCRMPTTILHLLMGYIKYQLL